VELEAQQVRVADVVRLPGLGEVEVVKVEQADDMVRLCARTATVMEGDLCEESYTFGPRAKLQVARPASLFGDDAPAKPKAKPTKRKMTKALENSAMGKQIREREKRGKRLIDQGRKLKAQGKKQIEEAAQAQTNTPRRARMAAHKIKGGTAKIDTGSILERLGQRIAESARGADNAALNRIRHRTQLNDLLVELRRATRRRVEANGERLGPDRELPPPKMRDVEFAELAPLRLYRDRLVDAARDLELDQYPLIRELMGRTPTGGGDYVPLKLQEAEDLMARMRELDKKSKERWSPFERVIELLEDDVRIRKTLGINTTAELRDALQALMRCCVGGVRLDTEEAKAAELRLKEAELMRRRIPGFFPTPEKLVGKMVDAADFANMPIGTMVLEPSAGSGAIARELRAFGDRLRLVEFNRSLAELLRSQGFKKVTQDNFLAWKPPRGERYSRILMNPPFEDRSDARHLDRALELLEPGGVLVSVVSGSFPSRTDALTVELRDRLEDMGASIEPQPDAKFENTNVRVALVTVKKPLESAARPPQSPEHLAMRLDKTSSMPTVLSIFRELDDPKAIRKLRAAIRKRFGTDKRLMVTGVTSEAAAQRIGELALEQGNWPPKPERGDTYNAPEARGYFRALQTTRAWKDAMAEIADFRAKKKAIGKRTGLDKRIWWNGSDLSPDQSLEPYLMFGVQWLNRNTPKELEAERKQILEYAQVYGKRMRLIADPANWQEGAEPDDVARRLCQVSSEAARIVLERVHGIPFDVARKGQDEASAICAGDPKKMIRQLLAKRRDEDARRARDDAENRKRHVELAPKIIAAIEARDPDLADPNAINRALRKGGWAVGRKYDRGAQYDQYGARIWLEHEGQNYIYALDFAERSKAGRGVDKQFSALLEKMRAMAPTRAKEAKNMGAAKAESVMDKDLREGTEAIRKAKVGQLLQFNRGGARRVKYRVAEKPSDTVVVLEPLPGSKLKGLSLKVTDNFVAVRSKGKTTDYAKAPFVLEDAPTKFGAAADKPAPAESKTEAKARREAVKPVAERPKVTVDDAYRMWLDYEKKRGRRDKKPVPIGQFCVQLTEPEINFSATVCPAYTSQPNGDCPVLQEWGKSGKPGARTFAVCEPGQPLTYFGRNERAQAAQELERRLTAARARAGAMSKPQKVDAIKRREAGEIPIVAFEAQGMLLRQVAPSGMVLDSDGDVFMLELAPPLDFSSTPARTLGMVHSRSPKGQASPAFDPAKFMAGVHAQAVQGTEYTQQLALDAVLKRMEKGEWSALVTEAPLTVIGALQRLRGRKGPKADGIRSAVYDGTRLYWYEGRDGDTVGPVTAAGKKPRKRDLKAWRDERPEIGFDLPALPRGFDPGKSVVMAYRTNDPSAPTPVRMFAWQDGRYFMADVRDGKVVKKSDTTKLAGIPDSIEPDLSLVDSAPFSLRTAAERHAENGYKTDVFVKGAWQGYLYPVDFQGLDVRFMPPSGGLTLAEAEKILETRIAEALQGAGVQGLRDAGKTAQVERHKSDKKRIRWVRKQIKDREREVAKIEKAAAKAAKVQAEAAAQAANGNAPAKAKAKPKAKAKAKAPADDTAVAAIKALRDSEVKGKFKRQPDLSWAAKRKSGATVSVRGSEPRKGTVSVFAPYRPIGDKQFTVAESDAGEFLAELHNILVEYEVDAIRDNRAPLTTEMRKIAEKLHEGQYKARASKAIDKAIEAEKKAKQERVRKAKPAKPAKGMVADLGKALEKRLVQRNPGLKPQMLSGSESTFKGGRDYLFRYKLGGPARSELGERPQEVRIKVTQNMDKPSGQRWAASMSGLSTGFVDSHQHRTAQAAIDRLAGEAGGYVSGLLSKAASTKDPYVGRTLADGGKVVGRDKVRGKDVYLIQRGIATEFLPAGEIAFEFKRTEERARSKARADAEKAERARKADAERASKRDLDGFEKTFKSKVALERAVAALDKQAGLDGKFATRRTHMRSLARKGWRVTEHPEGRRAESPTGTFYMETGRDGLTKIAMDYLAFLTRDAKAPKRSEIKAALSKSDAQLRRELQSRQLDVDCTALVRPLASSEIDVLRDPDTLTSLAEDLVLALPTGSPQAKLIEQDLRYAESVAAARAYAGIVFALRTMLELESGLLRKRSAKDARRRAAKDAARAFTALRPLPDQTFDRSFVQSSVGEVTGGRAPYELDPQRIDPLETQRAKAEVYALLKNLTEIFDGAFVKSLYDCARDQVTGQYRRRVATYQQIQAMRTERRPAAARPKKKATRATRSAEDGVLPPSLEPKAKAKPRARKPKADKPLRPIYVVARPNEVISKHRSPSAAFDAARRAAIDQSLERKCDNCEAGIWKLDVSNTRAAVSWAELEQRGKLEGKVVAPSIAMIKHYTSNVDGNRYDTGVLGLCGTVMGRHAATVRAIRAGKMPAESASKPRARAKERRANDTRAMIRLLAGE